MATYLMAFFSAANGNVAQMTEQTLAHENGAHNVVSVNNLVVNSKTFQYSIPHSAWTVFGGYPSHKLTLSGATDAVAWEAAHAASANTMKVVEMVAQNANTEFLNLTHIGEANLDQAQGLIQTDTSGTAQDSNLIATVLSGFSSPVSIS